jgi:hypothetical protein
MGRQLASISLTPGFFAPIFAPVCCESHLPSTKPFAPIPRETHTLQRKAPDFRNTYPILRTGGFDALNH